MTTRTADLPVSRLALLLLLCASMTMVQDWVGTLTLYSPSFAARRELMHESVLANRLPDGAQSWPELGANGLNIRVTVVYLAEGVRRLTDLKVGQVYRLIDAVALFAALIALFFYLRASVPPEYALLGLIYLSATLPLTAFFAYFHPWDRVSLLMWICLLLLLRADRIWLFTVLLAFSVTVKFDTILLPTLYWLVRVTRENWVSVSVRAAALFVVTFGVWILLQVVFGSLSYWDPWIQVQRNISDFAALPARFPPVLGFGLPVLLALAGLRDEPHFTRMSAIFGFLLLIMFAIITNFVEYRAELPALILILPAALGTLHRLLAMPARQPELARPLSRHADLVGQAQD